MPPRPAGPRKRRQLNDHHRRTCDRYPLVKLNNTPILSVQPGHITVHIIPLTTKAEVREFIQALEKAAEDAGLPENRKASV